MKKFFLSALFLASSLFSENIYYRSDGTVSTDYSSRFPIHSSFSVITVGNYCSSSDHYYYLVPQFYLFDLVQVSDLPPFWQMNSTNEYAYASLTTFGFQHFSDTESCLASIPTSFSDVVLKLSELKPDFDFYSIYKSFASSPDCPESQHFDFSSNSCVEDGLVCPDPSASSTDILLDSNITGRWVDGVCQSLDFVCSDSLSPRLISSNQYTCASVDCSAVPPPNILDGYDSYLNYDPTSNVAAFAVTEDECTALLGYKITDDTMIQSVLFYEPEPFKTQCPGWSLCLYSSSPVAPAVDCSLDSTIEEIEKYTNFRHLPAGDSSAESCVDNSILASYASVRYIDTATAECPDNPHLCFGVLAESCETKYNSTTVPSFSSYVYRSQLSKADCLLAYPDGYHFVPADCDPGFSGLCYSKKQIYDENSNLTSSEPNYDSSINSDSSVTIEKKTPNIRDVQPKTPLSGGHLTSTGKTYTDAPASTNPDSIIRGFEDLNNKLSASGPLGDSATALSEMNNRQKDAVDNYNSQDGKAQTEELGNLARDGFASQDGFMNNILDGYGLSSIDPTAPVILNFEPITFELDSLKPFVPNIQPFTLLSPDLVRNLMDSHIVLLRSVVMAIAAISAFIIVFRSN